MTERTGSPSVSVVVPILNRLALLRETVKSLRNQTLLDAEFILVDDGSTDNVWRYLEEVACTDARFTALRRESGLPPGAQSARNTGLDAATGEYIVFLDSDDLLSPECLAVRCEEADRDASTDILVGRQIVFGGGDVPRWVNIENRNVTDLDRFASLGHPIDVPWVNGGVMFRASALRERSIRWRPEFHWDDVAMHFECLVTGMKSRWMDPHANADFFYRTHGEERYGRVLSTDDGLLSAGAMMGWMVERLCDAGAMTASLRKELARSLFRVCVLPAIDTDRGAIAKTLTAEGLSSRVFTATDASNVLRYIRGRHALKNSSRATYHWNKLFIRYHGAEFFPGRISTYAAIEAAFIREPG